ncbi:MAG TPA: acetolactate synthase large subunit [Bacillales bacterium]|nr:acetolactate synthase large subunit [Bacillales bacterium]
MNLAELFIKCLEQQNVEYIFGVPGEENIDLLDALHESSIEFIPCRHETGAAFIAGMMGKLTGKPGVCLSTLGPGATNMMTGVACATLDRMPLIAITAQTDVPMQIEGTHQYLNVIDMYRPISKWGTSIQNGTVLPNIVSDAFQSAVSDAPGSIHLELPNDIASLPVAGQPGPLPIPPKQKTMTVSQSNFHDVATAINQAEAPLMFIGHRAANSETSPAVLSFIEKLQVPFTETYMAKGVVPGNHSLHMQTIGLPEGDFVNQAFDFTDLIITIGYDPIEYGTQKWNKAQKPIIHIDYQAPAKTDPFYPIKNTLIGDLSSNLQILTKWIQPRNEMSSAYRQLKEVITSDLAFHSTSDSNPLTPQRIIQEIRAVLAPDDLLLSDVGAHKLWIGRQYDALNPNTCIISNGLASMGIGLPGAIGAKLACPNKKVLAVCGDGAFLMSLPELETAVRLELPIVIMVWRDGRYAAIEWEQQYKLGRSLGVQFDNTNFVELAKTFGAKGYVVEEASQLADIMQKAFSEKGPVLIECPVDYTENSRLSERLNSFKSAFL